MTPNQELLTRFYQAFQARDGDGMAACYHSQATFSDPVFPALSAVEVGAMWRMLCSRAQDLRIEFRGIAADEQRGSAHWEAWYTFTATGRAVHNIIDASFEFRDGKILRHADRFDFPRWARQALGFKGLLLGHTRFLQNAVQANAAKSLTAFVVKSAGA